MPEQLPRLTITRFSDRKRLAICITTEKNISVPIAYLLKDEYKAFFCEGASSFNPEILKQVTRRLWPSNEALSPASRHAGAGD